MSRKNRNKASVWYRTACVLCFYILLVLLLGIWGYGRIYSREMSGFTLFLNSFYSAARLFAFETEVEPGVVNWQINVARYLGSLFTVGGIVLGLSQWMMSHRRVFRDRFITSRDRGAIIVYAEADKAERIRDSLQKTGEGLRVFVALEGIRYSRCGTHILAFQDDESNLAFLREHGQDLQGKKVILLSETLPSSDFAVSGGVNVCNEVTLCARAYWHRHWIAKGKTDPVQDGFEGVDRVALIGFGRYGQALLTQAFIVNVSLRERPLRYDVYGTQEQIRAYQQDKDLAAFVDIAEPASEADPAGERDLVCFYDMPDIGAILQADRIILALDDMEENLVMAEKLMQKNACIPIHIRARSAEELESVFGGRRNTAICTLPDKKTCDELEAQRWKNPNRYLLVPYGTAQDLYSADILLHDRLTRRAVLINAWYNAGYDEQLMYASMRGQYEAVTDAARWPDWCGQWEALGLHDKLSNISAADHDPVKREYLLKMWSLLNARGAETVRRFIQERLRLFGVASEEAWRTVHDKMPEGMKEQAALLTKACPGAGDAAAQKWVYLLACAEHERWCRLHFLNGWKQDTVKNKGLLRHTMLCPLYCLTEGDIANDWRIYEYLIRDEAH